MTLSELLAVIFMAVLIAVAVFWIVEMNKIKVGERDLDMKGLPPYHPYCRRSVSPVGDPYGDKYKLCLNKECNNKVEKCYATCSPECMRAITDNRDLMRCEILQFDDTIQKHRQMAKEIDAFASALTTFSKSFDEKEL